ncbi:hypothetical protein C1H46_026946 [Malus baccata]|uniref:DNA topoisomerase (ATP-hydrolyzing) n=1 Tax=Malus baccata TaxID=106549 RepID=A0A540LMH4_MALBA|nr:hypothetical protein C1H46_026946 [Malus baccata]
MYDNEEMVERPIMYALGLYWMLNDMLTDVALRIKNKMEVDIRKVDDAITICFANKSHEKFSILCKELELSNKFVPYCKKIIVSKADGNKLHKVFSRDNKNPQTDSSDHKSKKLWVRILLKPDLATSNMTSLNDDIVDLIKKRMIDIVGYLEENVEDDDGFHVKGLLINLFYCFCPSLLKIERFFAEFITPCIKGLGTFSPEEEGKDFFRNLKKHRKYIIWDDGANEAIDLVFNKKRADDRKEWLNNYIRLELKLEPDEQHSNRVNDDDEDEETHKNYIDFLTRSI